MVLIPKKKDPETVGDYRPISLCNVVYKIITKTISNLLKRVLPNLISGSQSTFVLGRLITDNVIAVFELLHSLHKRNNDKKTIYALKQDISKAYDWVEWRFVCRVMEKMGFLGNWVALVHDCMSIASFAFTVDKSTMGKILPSRGIRQDYSLSPYLFLFCTEALSSLIKGADIVGDLMGIQCTKAGPRVSHLFFANDSIIFTRHPSFQDYNNLKEILRIYKRASRQRSNFQKSVITFSPNIPRVESENNWGLCI